MRTSVKCRLVDTEAGFEPQTRRCKGSTVSDPFYEVEAHGAFLVLQRNRCSAAVSVCPNYRPRAFAASNTCRRKLQVAPSEGRVVVHADFAGTVSVSSDSTLVAI